MLYEVTFADSNKKLFEASDLSDLVYYLQRDFERECGNRYKVNDSVRIEERREER